MTPHVSTPGFPSFSTLWLWVICSFFTVLFPFPVWSQPVIFDLETRKITYTAELEVEGVEENELNARSREWMTDTFRHMQAVVRKKAGEKEQLCITAGFLYRSLLIMGLVWFDCSVSVEDEKILFVFTNFKFQNFTSLHFQGFNTYFPLGPPVSFEHPSVGSKVRILKETDKHIQVLIADLHQSFTHEPYTSRSKW